jgi:hypothetical protein
MASKLKTKKHAFFVGTDDDPRYAREVNEDFRAMDLRDENERLWDPPTLVVTVLFGILTLIIAVLQG